MPARVVWKSRLDMKWDVRVKEVVEGDETAAWLEIVDIATEEVVFTKPVSLAYGAIFGPDSDDVAEWQALAVSVVDSL